MDNQVDFQFVLDALLSKDAPFPPTLLYELSSIQPEDITSLTAIWPEILLERRRALLEDLESLTEKDNLLDFDDIGRIALQDSDAQTCINAMRLLWQAEDKRLVPQFIKFLKTHSEESVRAAAACALGPYVYMGEIDKLPAKLLHEIEEELLTAERQDTSDLVRQRALESLGYSGRPEVPTMLQAAYDGEETAWLESALSGMGHSVDDKWESAVIKKLDHPDPGVQLAAIHAAGELMLERARGRLLDMIEKEIFDEDLHTEVIWALSQIGGESVRTAFKTLIEMTADTDETDLLEDALDNLSFSEDAMLYDLMDIDPENQDDDDYDIDFDEDDLDY